MWAVALERIAEVFVNTVTSNSLKKLRLSAVSTVCLSRKAVTTVPAA